MGLLFWNQVMDKETDKYLFQALLSPFSTHGNIQAVVIACRHEAVKEVYGISKLFLRNQTITAIASLSPA